MLEVEVLQLLQTTKRGRDLPFDLVVADEELSEVGEITQFSRQRLRELVEPCGEVLQTLQLA